MNGCSTHTGNLITLFLVVDHLESGIVLHGVTSGTLLVGFDTWKGPLHKFAKGSGRDGHYALPTVQKVFVDTPLADGTMFANLEVVLQPVTYECVSEDIERNKHVSVKIGF